MEIPKETAPWLSDVDEQLSTAPIISYWSIDTRLFNRAIKLYNWKSPWPGLDCGHHFWLKHFSSLHPVIILIFNDLLSSKVTNLVVRDRTCSVNFEESFKGQCSR